MSEPKVVSSSRKIVSKTAQGHRERLRQRFLKDPVSLPDYELLELLLGYVLLRMDTKPLAKELLARFKTLKGVLNAQAAELNEFQSFGPACQSFWAVLRELNARYGEIPLRTKITLSDPKDVVEMARRRLAGLRHEEIWGAFLDNQNSLITWQCVSKGTGSQVFFSAPDVLHIAALYKASRIILVHNHPGGNPRPSTADVDLTVGLKKGAKQLAIDLLDHIIVTDANYFSMSDHNMLNITGF